MAKPLTIAEHFDEILLDVANKTSVVKACKDRKISPQTFYDYIETDEKLKERYTRARIDRGDCCTDTIEEYQRKLERGEIDAQTAKVLIDTEKWKAGKFNQQMYGDKANIEHSGTVNILPSIIIDGTEMTFDVGDDLH